MTADFNVDLLRLEDLKIAGSDGATPPRRETKGDPDERLV